MARHIVDRHLYLTEDRGRVVEENDPAGRWLWASPGSEVDMDEAVRLGAVQPQSEPAPEPEPEPEGPEAAEQDAAEPKARTARPANKARVKSEDK